MDEILEWIHLMKSIIILVNTIKVLYQNYKAYRKQRTQTKTK